MLKLKKILLCVPVLVLVFFLFTAFVYAEGNKIGTVNGDSLNVRQAPDTSAKIVTKLLKGTEVKVVEASGDWYKISYKEVVGWVFGQYLSVKDVAIGTGTVSGDNVNIRSNPDTTSEIVTKLNKGQKLSYFARSGDWYRVQLPDGKFGWIYKEFFLVRDSDASRGVVQDAAPKVEQPKEPEAKGTEESKDEEKQEAKIQQQVIDYAKKFLGVKYVYGGMSPKGFDCSGFVSYVFKNFGIKLERSSHDQAKHGVKVNKSELKMGDLVFFDTNGGLNAIEHVGIYIGGGKFIHSSSGRTTRKVVISDLTEGFYAKSYMTARRYLKSE